MPSHFSTIGLRVASKEELAALAERVAPISDQIEVKSGRYFRWSSESGAELWLQVDRQNNLIGINPHFTGSSVVRVGLTKSVTRSDDTVLDGAFYAWADPEEDDPETGSYPLVFDCPDSHSYSDLRLPSLAKAQIAAFAHELLVYESPEAYDESQTDGLKFASQSFIPSGLLALQAESIEPPEAYAIFTGHVLKCESKFNDLTEEPFHWALVETLGGVYDVVIDPEFIEVPPVVGGIVSGVFWLSGRLLKYTREKRSILRRFFGGTD
ncbi:MAG: hypothetical protein ACE5JP_12035 [Candidatus Bipolaricaulia bacterium]